MYCFKTWFSLLLMGLLLIVGCGDSSQPKSINPEFAGYVSAFSSGIISNGSTIVVRLAEDYPSAEIGKEVSEDVFDFSPGIDGKAYWTSERTIEFRPDEKLKSGQRYRVEFNLGKLVDVPSDLKVLEFSFETIKQAVFMEFEGMKAYNDEDLRKQTLFGKISTADETEIEELEGILAAMQNGKSLPVRWEHLDAKTHVFTIDSVARRENKEEVILTWNGEALDVDQTETETIQIPALSDFKVMSVFVIQQPQQHVKINFSDPINKKQELDGLVYFESEQEITIGTEGNQVLVYPKERILGAEKIIVNQGVKNTLDYTLKSTFEQYLTFENIKPNVELVGNGVILPSTDGLVFPFKAVNLKAVNVKIIKIFENNIAQFLQVNELDGTKQLKRVGRIVYKKEVPLSSEKAIDYGKWNTFYLDLADLIQTEPGAIYRISISFDRSQSLYGCEDANLEEEDNFGDDKEIAFYDTPSTNYWDDYDYYDYNDGYVWREREDPCKRSYYLRNQHTITQSVFASDLGIIAKGNDGKSLFAAITDLKTTDPISGVKVEVYNYQNQLMATQTTNAEGMVTVDLEGKPFLLVATNGNEKGYLRLDDGMALSNSMFDVGGAKLSKGVKGYIYGERGVWRPGDSLFVSFILEDKNRSIPSNHPVVFEFYTPQNQLYERKVKTKSLNGFYDFRTKTEQEAPTGNWLAKIKVGGSTFTKTIKIEAIKPNRLKIKADFGGDVIKKGDNTEVALEVKWLHGAVAKNLNTDVEMSVFQGRTSFKGFDGYSFDDPAKEFESQDQMVFDGSLDAQGKASFRPQIRVGSSAPGMLQASFKTRVFEKGGEFSVDRVVVPYSPYTSYVGVKVPEGPGWNGAIYSNEPNLIPIATVDQDGNPVSRSGVRIDVYTLGWRWWWDRDDDNDLARYISGNSANRIKSDYISTVDGKAMYELKFDQNTWGRKLIRITDPTSGHSTGQIFYTSYSGWWSQPGNNPGGAEMLSFSTNKTTYNVGEEVVVTMPEFKEGRALVSVESGSKIIKTFWAEGGVTNQFMFETTAEMTPNIYINVSLIQPHKRTSDTPIRMYGIQQIKVEDKDTHLEPVVNMPDELAPNEKFNVKVKEKNGKKMTYTIAVVDDGLLDLTRFKTPNPWQTFYAREALGIKTWDMYKYVAGAFSGEMAGLLALGGDGMNNNKGGKKANRFKPVVMYLGPFELDAGDEAKHTLTMPNYIGSVRTMVVAGQDGAYGSTEKTIPVKKALMVLATLPRVLGPGEKVTLPVTVFAMDPKVKNVKVTIESNELLQSTETTSKSIVFNEVGDKVVNFDLQVAEKLGMGKVKVSVEGGGEKASYDFEIDVRVPNPMITKVIDGVIMPGESLELDYMPMGMTGTNKAVIEASKIPSLNLEKRLQYLIQYPHGCIEQTTSSVFPQLHLSTIMDLNSDKKKQIQNNINAGIERLKLFQLSNGGLSYWPESSEGASEWGTNYGGHFLIEAKNSGYDVPKSMINGIVKYQKEQANSWSINSSSSRLHYYNSAQLTQAYRLYCLALAGKPARGAMNRMRELPNLTNAARWRLAAAYLLIGKGEEAEKLIAGAATTVEPYKELSYSYGSDVRDQAMILETLVLLKKYNAAKRVLDELAEHMSSSSWYSTQTTAYTLLAAAKFVKVSDDGSGGIQYVYSFQGKSNKIKSTAPIHQSVLENASLTPSKVKIENTGSGTLFIKLVSSGIPLKGDNTSDANDLTMKVSYLDLQGNSINPTILEQGTDFIAEIKIGHPGVRMDYKEMALTQIFPSGWEIRNNRMDLAQSNLLGDQPTYQDIRDDRVYSYFNISRGQTKTYRVLLNASYLGEFYLPTVYCEAMYDNEINARKGGSWVRVVPIGGEIVQE